LFEWNGVDAWVQKAPQLGSETHISSLAVFNGKLYGGTYPGGKLYEWTGSAWVERAPQLNGQVDILSLAVFNGKLYGSTGTSGGKLYEWNDNNAWVEKAPLMGSETYVYSLAVFNGKLYASALLGGNLFEWRSGVGVSQNSELGSGWRHLVAVRDSSVPASSVLRLYVDGVLVGTSSAFVAGDYDLSNARDLLIGFGAQDYFRGLVDEVAVYSAALSGAEVGSLYNGGVPGCVPVIASLSPSLSGSGGKVVAGRAFSVSGGVSCAGGSCGVVSLALDPVLRGAFGGWLQEPF